MKNALSLCLTVFVFFLYSNVVYAKNIAGKIGLGGNWFYYLSNDDEWEDIDLKIEETLAGGNARISYCLPKPSEPVNLNLILDWEFITREILIDEDTNPLSDNFGTLTMMPVMAIFQLRYPNLGMVVPYVGMGSGICFNNISKGGYWDDFEELKERELSQQLGRNIDLDVDLEIENSLCFKVPLGVDIFISDYLSFNFEAKYFYSMPKVDVDIDYDIGEKFDNFLEENTFAFGAGFNFYF